MTKLQPGCWVVEKGRPDAYPAKVTRRFTVGEGRFATTWLATDDGNEYRPSELRQLTESQAAALIEKLENAAFGRLFDE